MRRTEHGQATSSQSRGTLAEWQEQVARPLARHPIAAFAVMAAFVPCFLRFMPEVGNLTLELVGGPDTGKSTVQKLAASVAYPPDQIRSFRDVQRDLNGLREAARDYPLFLDHAEPALLTATKPKQAQLYAATAYDLPQGPGGRMTLLSGRQPLREACRIGSPDETVLTLHIPDEGNGAFAQVPEGFANCAEFADSLLAAATAHHGHAYPQVLRTLLDDPSMTKIKSDLADAQARFREIAEAAGFGGSPHRVLRAIGAIYAAGILAKQAKVLPYSFRCRAAALAALTLHQSAQVACLPFRQRLEQLVASGQLVTVDKGSNPTVQAHAALAAMGTLTIKSTGRTIRIDPDKIAILFPDWHRIKGSAEVRALMKVDGKNLAVWGHLAPGTERIRLFQFELPSAEEPTLLAAADADNLE